MSATVTINLKSDLQETQVHIARQDRDDAVVEAVGLFLSTLGPSVIKRIVDDLPAVHRAETLEET